MTNKFSQNICHRSLFSVRPKKERIKIITSLSRVEFVPNEQSAYLMTLEMFLHHFQMTCPIVIVINVFSAASTTKAGYNFRIAYTR